MKTLLKLYRLLSVLSVDVAIGAVCSSAWFGGLFGVEAEGIALIALGLTVWIIYTADHLLDARSIKKIAATKRHQFHQRYFSGIRAILLSAIVCDTLLLLFMSRQVFVNGLWLALLVIVYLAVHRWLGFLKEFLVAILYCAGVLLPILSHRVMPTTLSQGLIVAGFFLTVFINILVFSWFDCETDRRDGQPSFATFFGFDFTQQFIAVLFIVQAILLVAIAYWAGSRVFLLMSMNIVLLFIFCNAKKFKANYRIPGDAIFFFPAVDLFLRWIFQSN